MTYYNNFGSGNVHKSTVKHNGDVIACHKCGGYKVHINFRYYTCIGILYYIITANILMNEINTS